MTDAYLKNFYTRLGHLYDEERYVHVSGWGKARTRFIRRKLRQYLRAGTILDIGCGGGVLLSKIGHCACRLDLPNFNLIGLDISPGSLARARERVPYASFVCADAEQIPLASNSVNFALCSETIEHLANPESFMAELARVLAPDSLALITCPNWHGDTKPVNIETGVLDCFGMDHGEYIHTAYQPGELAAMARDVGLEVLESGSFEKELRYWGRAWDIVLELMFRVLRSLRMPDWMFRLNYYLHSAVGGVIFNILWITGIAALMRLILGRGPRTFIILQKPQRAPACRWIA